MTLINGNCLEVMKDISNNSIDLLFCDLPYGQTSCKWDCLIDLELFWKQVNRICKDDTAMFFTCSTKFGVTLINSNPKNFRYDLVWVKSSPCGFLNAKKMPMKKHEMVYVFYKKLPKIYTDNIAEHHTHKFIKETANKRKGKDGTENRAYMNRSKTEISNKYDPPLPTSVIKDENLYIRGKETNNNNEDVYNSNERINNGKLYHHPRNKQVGSESIYDPPLPTSVIKDEKTINTLYGGEHAVPDYVNKRNKKTGMSAYDPPLPTSVIRNTADYKNESEMYGNIVRTDCMRKNNESMYEPPLPNTILEIASQKGKHSTQKPVDLIKWCLKYYSKEGDTILDPTMGSGSTGVACNEMNRKFIGIEMDETIFKVAEERVNV
jgi:DNA modification methylase